MYRLCASTVIFCKGFGFLFVAISLTYLKERPTEREQKMERRREKLFIYRLTLKMATEERVSPCLSQDPGTSAGPPTWIAGTQVLKLPFVILPFALAWSWIESGQPGVQVEAHVECLCHHRY